MIVYILLLLIILKDSNPQKTITCDVSIFTVSETSTTRQAGLVRCSQYALWTSPYVSKLASG